MTGTTRPNRGAHTEMNRLKTINMRRILCIIIMTICVVCAEAQIRSSQNYVVITFEQVVNKTTRDYYWIIPIDSLDQIQTLPAKIPLYPLYLDESSEGNNHRCIEGDMMYYLDNYSASSDKYDKFVQDVMSIVKNHRKLLETIEIGWKNRSNKRLYVEELKEKRRKISIFCTPLSGVFANCPICEDLGLGGEFFSCVFLPVKDISYFPDFWDTNHPELLSRTNFMYMDYSSYIMYSGRISDDISKPVLGK